MKFDKVEVLLDAYKNDDVPFMEFPVIVNDEETTIELNFREYIELLEMGKYTFLSRRKNNPKSSRRDAEC